jgi:histone H3/H4
MTDELFDPPPDQVADLARPADRDERRVLALQRFMRRAIEQERRVGSAAVRKLTEAFRGNSRED